MGKNTSVTNDISNKSSSINQEIINQLLFDSELLKLKEVINSLSLKYGLCPDELTKLATSKEEIKVPVSIFKTKKLSMLGLTVKYLKEELNLRYSEIGKLLNRNERTIWVTYSKAIIKFPSKLKIAKGFSIPIDVFSQRKFSILEHAVGYLKEEHSMKFSQIARILKRDDRTIWTCYHRLKQKRNGENEAR